MLEKNVIANLLHGYCNKRKWINISISFLILFRLRNRSSLKQEQPHVIRGRQTIGWDTITTFFTPCHHQKEEEEAFPVWHTERSRSRIWRWTFPKVSLCLLIQNFISVLAIRNSIRYLHKSKIDFGKDVFENRTIQWVQENRNTIKSNYF